ncbi:MAG: adenylate/guanylate cyclase domain-containing protein [Spirochaetaceae bacterium]|jgi:adenylate cyclase|nr:adenylate/guanylate cyclase domain-containing protein [Spirochaetaceae bacterium]
MIKSDKPVKTANDTKPGGKKHAGAMVWICVFSLLIILASVAKILYDGTLESAEAENAAVNRQTAAVFDIFFSNMRGASLILLETADTGAPENGNTLAATFFENNPHAAAVTFYEEAGKKSERLTFINESFFSVNGASPRLLDIFTELHIYAVDTARKGGKTVLNGETIFGFPLLAMFFPYRGGAGIVFFYPTELRETLTARTTYCINMDGSILVYSEHAPRRGDLNLSNHHFVKTLSETEQNSGQEYYVSNTGERILGAYTMLDSVPAALITETTYRAALSGLLLTAKRAVLIAACVIFFMTLILVSFIKSINTSLKKLELFDNVNHELEVVSRFADMRLARQSLEGALTDEAEYKKATLLLSEIEAFNGVAGRLNPKEAVSLINDYAVRMEACVNKTNGSIEQLQDGSIMAHWGSICASGDISHDALNAVRCALMMRVSVYELNKEREAAGKPYLKFFCGISSGEFIDGIASCNERSRHVLIGETAVIADIAKAQNIVFDTDILISESAWRLTQKYIVFEEVAPLQIEGREKPLRIFALINLKTRSGEAQVFPATLSDVRGLYFKQAESGGESLL